MSLALVAFTLLVSAYFVLWNVSQIVLGAVAARFLWQHQRRYTRRARALTADLPEPPLVSIVVPAHDEEMTIVDSLQALLALDYEARELVVVNDGSSDRTLETVRERFQLVPAPVAFAQPLRSEPIRGLYRSVVEPALVVVDKHNGGSKSDAVNAGINAASGELVLVIDADTVLEPEALTRAIVPFLEDPTTIAVGGNIAIVNGCRVERGRITDIRVPRSWLARFQIVEYMRSFMLFRLACAALNAVPLISGAFGLFRRDALLAVGGYDRDAIGEDMDLTIRLQRHYRERGEPARIAFDPNPLAWTQAPEDLASLRAQRCRWRRGLLQVLWRSRGTIGNPRYGSVGLGAMPYLALFDGFGPVIELLGHIVVLLGAAFDLLNWGHWRLLLVVSALFSAGVTLLALFLSDVETRRYMRKRDLFMLVAAVIFESFGYRQMNAWWGWVGTVQAMTGTSGWGPMQRRAFQR